MISLDRAAKAEQVVVLASDGGHDGGERRCGCRRACYSVHAVGIRAVLEVLGVRDVVTDNEFLETLVNCGVARFLDERVRDQCGAVLGHAADVAFALVANLASEVFSPTV
jgi:hypothetical protein